MTNDTVEPTSEQDNYHQNLKKLSDCLNGLIDALGELERSDEPLNGIKVYSPARICIEIMINTNNRKQRYGPKEIIDDIKYEIEGT